MSDINVRGVIVSDDDAWIYDYMGMTQTHPSAVSDAIASADANEPLDVYINSPGGEINAGSEIYSALKRAGDRVHIHITGEAASAASVIAMAGWCDMEPTARMMVHNVSTTASGDYRDMDAASEALKTANRAIAAAYVAKTGMTEKDALSLMDHETWLTAQDALDYGLIDAISAPQSDKTGGDGQFTNSTAETLPEAVKTRLRAKREALIEYFDNLNTED
ncbi:head maturation protease, ClpP-related [Galactobacillus timonensis]|uniref:head maturation protease, ClpP-related n=1 Tax=Galactobacillus timonensis TaxID=2041840 RepID=UPI000C8532ED|nr:head maturation protease, ClpP-related [Galactobacillus timonensis]